MTPSPQPDPGDGERDAANGVDQHKRTFDFYGDDPETGRSLPLFLPRYQKVGLPSSGLLPRSSTSHRRGLASQLPSRPASGRARRPHTSASCWRERSDPADDESQRTRCMRCYLLLRRTLLVWQAIQAVCTISYIVPSNETKYHPHDLLNGVLTPFPLPSSPFSSP